MTAALQPQYTFPVERLKCSAPGLLYCGFRAFQNLYVWAMGEPPPAVQPPLSRPRASLADLGIPAEAFPVMLCCTFIPWWLPRPARRFNG